MRTSLYNKLTQTKHSQQKKKLPKEKTILPSTKKQDTVIKEQRFKPDDVCKTYCSINNNDKECSRIRKDARIASSTLLKRYLNYEIEQDILGELGTSLEELLIHVWMLHLHEQNKLPGIYERFTGRYFVK